MESTSSRHRLWKVSRWTRHANASRHRPHRTRRSALRARNPSRRRGVVKVVRWSWGVPRGGLPLDRLGRGRLSTVRGPGCRRSRRAPPRWIWWWWWRRTGGFGRRPVARRRVGLARRSGRRRCAARSTAQEHNGADRRGYQEHEAAADPNVPQRDHEVIDEQRQVELPLDCFGLGRRLLRGINRRGWRYGRCRRGGRSRLDWRRQSRQRGGERCWCRRNDPAAGRRCVGKQRRRHSRRREGRSRTRWWHGWHDTRRNVGDGNGVVGNAGCGVVRSSSLDRVC